MKEGDKCTLLTDVVFKNGKYTHQYAKAGDEVTVIWISLPAVIVEGKERFSVNISQLEKV